MESLELNDDSLLPSSPNFSSLQEDEVVVVVVVVVLLGVGASSMSCALKDDRMEEADILSWRRLPSIAAVEEESCRECC